MIEPLLCANPNRFVLFPITDNEIWDFYKRALASFWTVEEIDLSRDLVDWETRLNNEERTFIAHTLAFFAGADGIVNENLVNNFAAEVQSPEARCFYGFQITMENIHNETYSLLLDTYISDEEQKLHLLRGIATIPSIKRKADWALHWCDSQKQSFAHRLVAFAAVEGIFFSSSFASIFWLKHRGLMPGLCFSNELISRDEGLHCEFACHLHRSLQCPAAANMINSIIISAVELEKEFAIDALETDLLGINSTLMGCYIEFCGDHLLEALGQRKYYNTNNPFDWMTSISLTGKTNFFEKRVSEYAKAGVKTGSLNRGGNKNVFDLEADF